MKPMSGLERKKTHKLSPVVVKCLRRTAKFLLRQAEGLYSDIDLKDIFSQMDRKGDDVFVYEFYGVGSLSVYEKVLFMTPPDHQRQLQEIKAARKIIEK